MKLRIKGNSLRLRLSRTEVKMLSEKAIVTETIHFGTTALVYALTAKNGLEKPEALFYENNIIVSIPDSFTATWADNEVVGIEGEQHFDDSPSLKILVEKDFQCLDETTEDQSDNYVNPNSTC